MLAKKRVGLLAAALASVSLLGAPAAIASPDSTLTVDATVTVVY